MKRAILVALMQGVLLVGCTQKDDPTPELEPMRQPQKAAHQLDQAYANAEPATRTALTELEKSMHQKDYEGVVAGLQVLQTQPQRTFEQSQVLNGLMAGLQKELADAAERGDPKALRAIQALKRSAGR